MINYHGLRTKRGVIIITVRSDGCIWSGKIRHGLVLASTDYKCYLYNVGTPESPYYMMRADRKDRNDHSFLFQPEDLERF